MEISQVIRPAVTCLAPSWAQNMQALPEVFSVSVSSLLTSTLRGPPVLIRSREAQPQVPGVAEPEFSLLRCTLASVTESVPCEDGSVGRLRLCRSAWEHRQGGPALLPEEGRRHAVVGRCRPSQGADFGTYLNVGVASEQGLDKFF